MLDLFAHMLIFRVKVMYIILLNKFSGTILILNEEIQVANIYVKIFLLPSKQMNYRQNNNDISRIDCQLNKFSRDATQYCVYSQYTVAKSEMMV